MFKLALRRHPRNPAQPPGNGTLPACDTSQSSFPARKVHGPPGVLPVSDAGRLRSDTRGSGQLGRMISINKHAHPAYGDAVGVR
ncbi:hypothetical protein GCM10009679_65350 [Saccharothrix algeriensis]|uniref:Uncharacterized protein n=1 Tax=Catellatospora bangladeshensis TaxID=310355 RepID=A0A8J3JZI8_9ACTN|nr:hypothetical protein Cba03nite_72180 [Catellatospora bangladeshensis]